MLISKEINCPNCESHFVVKEYSPGHVGIAFYHCDQCARSVVQHKSKIPPNYQQSIAIEEYLKDCECGGRFKSKSGQRCPECSELLDISKILSESNLDAFDLEVTKRNSGGYYVEGFNCDLKWREI